MGSKITFDQFLSRARKVWGDTYDYTEPKDFNFRSGRVMVICKKKGHPSTLLVPTNHITKNRHRVPAGCRTCFLEKDSNEKQKPFADFVRDARAVHGEKYDYIEETYHGVKPKIAIICSFHKKIFWQSPDSHINGGRGCPDCAPAKYLDTTRAWRLQNIRNRLLKMTDGTVLLVEETFVKWHAEADFVCHEHGQFSRSVFNALTSLSPCPECNDGSLGRSLNHEEILYRFSLKKGNFTILEIDGYGSHAKVEIACHDCDRGQFTLKVTDSYKREYACGGCSRKASKVFRLSEARKYHKANRANRFVAWVALAKEKHHDKYDYSLVEYINSVTKVKIICSKHKVFEQKPSDHLAGGCRKCADEKLHGLYSETYFERFPDQKEISGILYYVRFDHECRSFFKVGITKNSLIKRFSSVVNSGFKMTILAKKVTTMYLAFLSEQKILSEVDCDGNWLEDETFLDELRDSGVGTTEVFGNALSDDLVQKFFRRNQK